MRCLTVSILKKIGNSDESKYALSQWKTSLQYNNVELQWQDLLSLFWVQHKQGEHDKTETDMLGLVIIWSNKHGIT